MNQCLIRGCRNLETKCADCGQLVISRIMPPAMEWIYIEERLPQDGDIVLCYQTYPKDLQRKFLHRPLRNCFRQIVRYSEYFQSFTNIQGRLLPFVSHWMPLPEPPRSIT